MLYFSPNSLLTLHPIKGCKSKKFVFLPVVIMTCDVSLHPNSEVRNSVGSCMQRVVMVFLMVNVVLSLLLFSLGAAIYKININPHTHVQLLYPNSVQHSVR